MTDQIAELTVEIVGKKPEKKNGYLKTKDGTWYSVPPSLVDKFQKDETCKVSWKSFGDDGRSIISKIWNGQQNAPKQITRPRMDATDSLEARKTASLVAFIAAGKVSLNRDTIKLALDEIEAGCRMHMKQPPRDDMSDEIGF